MTPDEKKHWDAQNAMSYLWHWWINSLKPDGPAGCPHEGHLYGFKSMLESLHYFRRYLRDAFTDNLRKQHQQCSHQQPEELVNNQVCCALGKNVTECPILLNLKESFEKNCDQYYRDRVPEDGLYELMARTCGWHMLSTQMLNDRFIDWNEGAMQDVSDRTFWDRTYQSLSKAPKGNP